MPDNLIVIGSNGAGDLLVYKINASNKLDPKVYWLDHETEALLLAGNDFSELFNDIG